MRLQLFLLFACTCVIEFVSGQPSSGKKKDKINGEWKAYGHDAGGDRFSPLQQINTGNIKNLKPAWTYQTGELKTYEGTRTMEKAAFEATPLMIGQTLYFSTPTCRVIAIDAATGKEKWVYDPKVNLKKDYSEISSRGVSAWSGKNELRIFVATIDGRLIALDAATGKPISGFGAEGTVDLKEGIGKDLSDQLELFDDFTRPGALTEWQRACLKTTGCQSNFQSSFPRRRRMWLRSTT